MSNFETLLRRYLSVYWLRPVTALVRTLEAEILKLNEEKGKSTLDLACGDGVNSFIAMGGKIPEELDFDVFQSVPLPSAEKFFSGKMDIYDTIEDQMPLLPSESFWKTGLDHKANLINKARRLGSYKDLVVHDLNKKLPLEDGSFDFVFSNSLYWVQEINPLMGEIRRISTDKGRCKFVIIKPSFLDHMAWSKLKNFHFRQYLDMGRHLHYQQFVPVDEWRSKFERSGLEIVKETPIFNKELIHMIELHDLREISPLTTAMSKALPKEDKRKIKAEWINYFSFLFTKMKDDNYFEAPVTNSHYTIFELRAKK